MKSINIHPGIIAASIAGGGIGAAHGIMTRGEELEMQGASDMRTISGSLVGGAIHGVAGVGIGAGAAGTVLALKKVLGK